EIDHRADALAAGLQDLRSGHPQPDVAAGATPKVIGIMARNHRGFVESLIAANRIGADVLLLNTSFAGPALAEVVARDEGDAVIYDAEYAARSSNALTDSQHAAKIVDWKDDPAAHAVTVAGLINGHGGQ